MLGQIFFKRLRFFPLLLSVIIASLSAITASGNNTEPSPAEASYVIIGAFAYENNAMRFVEFAREQTLDAKYALNPNRDLYYVYVFSSENVQDAIRKVHAVRDMPDFRDAWVFTGNLGTSTSEYDAYDRREEVEEVNGVEVVAEEAEEEELIVEEQEEEMYEEEPEEEPGVIENEPVENGIDKKEGFYYLYFNAINKKTLQEVKGNVKILDLERVKEIGVGKTHEVVELKDPNNGTNRIKLISDIFGFKEIQHELDLDQPVNDTTDAYVSMAGDSIVVNFELERFKKGDVLVMYNVYFYVDAAIMKPESVYELNSFLDMLRENEKLKVRIHGHTNGNSHGKIIHLNPDDKNFFSLNADHKETVGSAKKLSLYRAETIRDWVLQQGISEDRVEVKGWGGKKMIYDKHDPQAYKNVRVEVEIIAE